jgi:hypothetical protein
VSIVDASRNLAIDAVNEERRTELRERRHREVRYGSNWRRPLNLESAIEIMVIRYGSSIAASVTRGLDDGRSMAEMAYHDRASRRRFAAMQRLTRRIPQES